MKYKVILLLMYVGLTVGCFKDSERTKEKKTNSAETTDLAEIEYGNEFENVDDRDVILKITEAQKLVFSRPHLRADMSENAKEVDDACIVNESWVLSTEYDWILKCAGTNIELRVKEFLGVVSKEGLKNKIIKEMGINETVYSKLKTNRQKWGSWTRYCSPTSSSVCWYFLELKKAGKVLVMEGSFFWKIDPSVFRIVEG